VSVTQFVKCLQYNLVNLDLAYWHLDYHSVPNYFIIGFLGLILVIKAFGFLSGLGL